VRLTNASKDMLAHVDQPNSYFKCTECDQTCSTCRGEKAIDGFTDIGWVEDKSQCLQPCPTSKAGGANDRNLPYFIKEKVVVLTEAK